MRKKGTCIWYEKTSIYNRCDKYYNKYFKFLTTLETFFFKSSSNGLRFSKNVHTQ